MFRAQRFLLVLVVSFSLTRLACGGESKPAETPALREYRGGELRKVDRVRYGGPRRMSASSAPEADPSSPAAASAFLPAPAPPPAPSLGSTDCGGQCIDKTCAKQAAACGKNGDCRLDDGRHALLLVGRGVMHRKRDDPIDREAK